MLDSLNDNDLVFTSNDNIVHAIALERDAFNYMMDSIGLTELKVEEREYKLVWLIKILEKLGKNNSEKFVEHWDDDIWEFIDETRFN